MMKCVDRGRMGVIDKRDWCAVNKASGRNRSRKGVLHWSVRASRAHAALLIRDGFLFCWFLLGKRGIQKKSRTNGLHCGGAGKARRLAGSRGWHQAPAQSCYPRSIFAQSWRAGLTDGRNIKNSGGEGGDYIARVCTTLLVSVTSLVIPVFSVLYSRVSSSAPSSPLP